MKVEEISETAAEEALGRGVARVKWTEIIEAVQADGKPRKVSGLTRGQVSALYRRAREAGLRVRTDYADGSVVLAAAVEAEG